MSELAVTAMSNRVCNQLMPETGKQLKTPLQQQQSVGVKFVALLYQEIINPSIKVIRESDKVKKYLQSPQTAQLTFSTKNNIDLHNKITEKKVYNGN